MTWDKYTEEKFNLIIAKIPIFMRDIAKGRVAKKAESFANSAGRSEVSEKDMVDAFFAETPFGFHGPMKTDMEEVGINYVQYGHGR